MYVSISDATHASVAANSSLLAMISLVAKHNRFYKHLDVKTTCLNFSLTYEVWVRFVTGYMTPLGDSFAKLRKSFYGLRQSAVYWYELYHHRLMAFDLIRKRSKVDPCFHFRVKDGPQFFFIIAQVDDYAVAYSDQHALEEWLLHFRGTLGNEDYLDV